MRSCLFLAGVLILSAAVASAQTANGTITGLVSDPAGAVVPNAQVEDKNVETGFVYPAIATSTGNYTIPSIPAGVYNITVEHSGFRKYIQTGVTVQVAQSARLDVVLQVTIERAPFANPDGAAEKR